MILIILQTLIPIDSTSNFPSANDDLNNAINDAGDTTVTVDDATGFPESGTVQIGSEKITYVLSFGASQQL